MFWTHIYDFLCKWVAMGISVGIFIQGQNVEMFKGTFLAFVATVTIGPSIWYFLLRPLSSWCYARFSLKTDLTFAESRRASVLFSPLRNLTKWYPMVEVKGLPQDERRLVIVNTADRILFYFDERSREWRAAPLLARILRVLLWGMIAFMIVAALTNEPPMSWVSHLQAMVFGGYSWNLITAIIGVLPPATGLWLLERRYGIRSPDPEEQARHDLSRKPEDCEKSAG